MSSISLERYQARHPSEREAIARLGELLASDKEYRVTLDQLADKVRAHSRDELAMILGELAAAGFLDYLFQVSSPSTHEPIRSFKSLKEIPHTLPDKTTDTNFQVNLEEVRPVYFWKGAQSKA